ncbi:Ubiquitin system component CUE [Dillenia turbinata]|uniref:Ubiquitin system component CUE n=1 Tax=Dillenia turbinata TaxID=194707 RepID=A0AAN8U8I7_9MAGN
MSAIVCGSKRSFFEEPTTSPPLHKKLRCSSSFSPPRSATASPFAVTSDLVDHLRTLFPHMDDQVLERALAECGNDLDSAIKSLHELHLGSIDGNIHSVEEQDDGVDKVAGSNNVDVASSENPALPNIVAMDGSEWVELFVKEMMSSSSLDDARVRATRVLESLEKTISARAGAEAAQSFQKENMMLKEHLELLMRENGILKRAVAIQHERHKEHEERNQELQNLKQLVSQYQEQLRTLEVKNYTLTMHLKQAQQNNSIPGRFHPDVF